MLSNIFLHFPEIFQPPPVLPVTAAGIDLTPSGVFLCKRLYIISRDLADQFHIFDDAYIIIFSCNISNFLSYLKLS